MPISPCLGCGLTVDGSSNLIIDGVVSEVWPHSCAIGTENGLRCDSVSNALWTDPPTHSQWTGSSKAHVPGPAPDVWVFSGPTGGEFEDLELVNESDCFSMDVLYIFTVGFGVSTISTSGVGVMPSPRWRIMMAFGGAPFSGSDTVNSLFVQPQLLTGMSQSDHYTGTFLSTVAPGGTARMRAAAKCDNASAGAMTMVIGQINFTFRMYGVSAR